MLSSYFVFIPINYMADGIFDASTNEAHSDKLMVKRGNAHARSLEMNAIQITRKLPKTFLLKAFSDTRDVSHAQLRLVMRDAKHTF